MRAVDTNILVRLITRDDVAQLASAEAFVAKGAWVSTLVLAEATWVQDAAVVAAALTNDQAFPALGFTDCLLVEIARKAGHLPVGTLDKRLAGLDGVERL